MKKPNLLKSFARIQRAANRVSWLPILMLEVTDRCNSRCNMCDIWKDTEKREPDSRRLEALVLGLKKRGLRHILITGGEPLLRDDLFELCERLSRHRAKLVLNTNGLLLEKFGQEVAAHFGMVIVSLDSHDGAIYQSIRGCDGFREVTEGIKSLKKRGGHVMLSHTLQKRNVHELASFIAFSKKLSVDRVSVRPVDAFSSAFARGNPRPDLFEELIPGEEDIRKLSRFIDVIEKKNCADIQRGFLRPDVEGFKLIRDYFSACRGLRDFPKRECDMPFISLTVEAGGAVKPCFFLRAFSNIYGVDWSKMGTVLNSEGLADVRRQYRAGQIGECQACVQPYSADF